MYPNVDYMIPSISRKHESDMVEAIIGAAYLDGGVKASQLVAHNMGFRADPDEALKQKFYRTSSQPGLLRRIFGSLFNFFKPRFKKSITPGRAGPAEH